MTHEKQKELYATGEWICVTKCNGLWFIENIDRYGDEYHFSYVNKLIHKRHSEVLDHVLSGGRVNCTYECEDAHIEDVNDFIEHYHEDNTYEIIKDKPVELKSCPFCGSNDIDDSSTLQNNGYVGAGCINCGASTECKKDKQEAIDAWNIRTLHKPVEHITREDMACELWALAQLKPNEGIEDGVNRIIEYLEANQKE